MNSLVMLAHAVGHAGGVRASLHIAVIGGSFVVGLCVLTEVVGVFKTGGKQTESILNHPCYNKSSWFPYPSALVVPYRLIDSV